MVPSSRSPGLLAMVGQPAAGSTSPAPPPPPLDGGGLAGGLLMVMLPPLPGDTIWSAPQPARLAATAAATIHFETFIDSLSSIRPDWLDAGKSLAVLLHPHETGCGEPASCRADTHEPWTCGRTGNGIFTLATGGAAMLSASMIHNSLS